MILIIPDHIIWQDVPGELLLLNGETGSYHAFNASAAAIWREIASGASTDAVSGKLAHDHGAPLAAVAEDVTAFVTAALAKHLLVRAPV